MEILDSDSVNKAIEEACAFTVENYFINGKCCAAAKNLFLDRAEQSDLSSVFALLDSYTAIDPRHPTEKTVTREWKKDACDFDVPNFYGLILKYQQAENNGGSSYSCCGLITFHLAYSTWDGRVLFLDKMILPKPENTDMETRAIEWSLNYTMADIAIRVGCTRYTWQHTLSLPTYPSGEIQPEYLEGWLTLHQQQEKAITIIATKDETWNSESDRTAIEDCITQLDQTEANKQIRLRLSTENDLEDIERLVMGLALYEKEPESVHITREHYRRDGFTDGQPPLYYCLLLEDVSREQPYVCGMAFCYFGFAFGEGRFLYLEDLFIETEYRGKGGGGLAMKTLAKIARSLQCVRMVWQALDWNTPALNFYSNLGAKVQDGLMTSRLAGDDLHKFHNSRTSY